MPFAKLAILLAKKKNMAKRYRNGPEKCCSTLSPPSGESDLPTTHDISDGV